MDSLANFTVSKTVDAQLMQLQKMEAIGRLAGGVAHDFNNLLTIILGCTELLLARHGHDGSSHDLLHEIKTASDRASLLTRQLLTFSRKQPSQTAVVNLNAIVADMVKLLRRLIGEHIELTTTLDPALRSIQADPGQLGQVITNLVVNARDAMPQGGRLTITTANVVLEEAPAAEARAVPPGSYTLLTVEDTGCGMNEEVRAHLFEPFFTTKGPGKGTGLGLATIYGVVQQSGGHITVSSRPGLGSSFQIFLPQVEGSAATELAGRNEPGRKVPGQETILLVEDERALLKLSSQILQAQGYQVLPANNGTEALKVASRHDGPINLLVTDVIMPMMSGPKLAGLMLAHWPQMRVLFMSGYTDSMLAGTVPPYEAALLTKPFTSAALLEEVRKALDGKPPQ